MSKLIFERGTLQGMRIHVMPTKQFKTCAISIYVGIPLQEHTVTSVALTPFVLCRGTNSYPETIHFRQYLDEMYGAGFTFDLYKRGDYQIIQFRMDIIHNTFIRSADCLLAKAFQFLGEVLTAPVMENGLFYTKYVSQEKQMLRQRIESIINDKIQYAAHRCIEEMCKYEPYRLHVLGDQKQVPIINAEMVTTTYQTLLEQAGIDVYVVGDTTYDEIERYIATSFHLQRRFVVPYVCVQPKLHVEPPKTVIEHFKVNQGKLNLGLRSMITYADDSYPAVLVYNGILGAYPHSRLFLHVREQHHLAYYIHSRYDGHKGICTIQSGIECEQFECACKIIIEQTEVMKTRSVEQLEMERTKAMLISQLQQVGDGAFSIIEFDFNQILAGCTRTTSQLMEQIQHIDETDIQTVASAFHLHTIYFLCKGEEV